MKGNKDMYDIPEPRYYLEPKEGEIVGYCAECGQDIYAGEDIWEIKYGKSKESGIANVV